VPALGEACHNGYQEGYKKAAVLTSHTSMSDLEEAVVFLCTPGRLLDCTPTATAGAAG